MSARCYLFVPADRPERFEKALAAGADEVIIDLEDAVAAPAKDAARAALAGWLSNGERRVTLRINATDTPWFAQDLQLCALPGVSGVMLPKAERAEDLARVAAVARERALLPLIESAAGFDQLRAVAGAPGVRRLAFGSIDFQLDLGIDGEGEELLFFRSQLVLASRLANLEAPIDGVSTAIDDGERLEQEATRARRLGFGAKLCIHPRQVAVVQRSFAASEQQIAWARRVIEAFERAQGAAVAVEGTMVDRPVMLRARALLRQAGET
jgi:citrate lyase subunit beta/citryl-CoA lyase